MIISDDVTRLEAKHRAWMPYLMHCDRYYEGLQPIHFMAPALREEFGERITPLIINLPRIGAKAYEARLDVEGFRFAGDASSDQRLWDVWQANDMDEQAQQGHLDSLVMSRSYAVVGSAESGDDMPVLTVESPLQMFAERDPRTRRILKAIKRWSEEDGTDSVMLYTGQASTLMRQQRGRWLNDGPPDNHELGRPPVVVLPNNPRLLRPDGVSEFHDIIPIADAVNKMATDMMVSGEFHAMPRRWAFGLKASDFVDENGEQLSPWSRDAGTLWSSENPDAKVGQFNESDLSVFHNTIRTLIQIASQTLALPPHYLSFTGDNPASADAIRSSETQLVKNVERKHTFLGGAWEDVMRIALRFMDGEWDPAARSLETMWRDPSTPTVAQKADAIQKLTGGRPVMPIEMAREELGWSPEKRRRAAEMDRSEVINDPLLAAAGGGALTDDAPVA